MVDHPTGPLNFTGFWSLLGRLSVALMKQRAHADVHIIFRDGQIQIVQINRSYRPQDLPEI